jgi:hypothetical protein
MRTAKTDNVPAQDVCQRERRVFRISQLAFRISMDTVLFLGNIVHFQTYYEQSAAHKKAS